MRTHVVTDVIGYIILTVHTSFPETILRLCNQLQ